MDDCVLNRSAGRRLIAKFEKTTALNKGKFLVFAIKAKRKQICDAWDGTAKPRVLDFNCQNSLKKQDSQALKNYEEMF